MAGNFNISYIFKVIDKFSPAVKKISRQLKKFDVSVKQTAKPLERLQERLRKSSFATSDMTRSILSLAGAYFSLRGAISFGKSLINTQIQMQNINASLKAVTGSQKLATEEFKFARKVSDELGISFEKIIRPYTKFLASSKLGKEESRKVFVAFNKMSRVFGLTGEQSAGVFRALEQMQSKGKVMSEELRLQLGDRLPDALNLFAKAAIEASDGQIKNTAEFVKFMEQGRLGAGLIKHVARVIERELGDAAVDASKTLGAEIARLQNRFFDLRVELSSGLFGTFVLNAVKFLTKNIDILAKIVLVLAGIFALTMAIKIPFMFLDLALSAGIALIPLIKLLVLLGSFALLNPFGLIITGLLLLLALFPKLRKDFVTIINWMKEKVKNFVSATFNWLKPFAKIFTGIAKGIDFINEKTGYGKEEVQNVKDTLEFTGSQSSMVDINANFSNVPFGTKIITSSPDKNINIGTNMSFAGGF